MSKTSKSTRQSNITTECCVCIQKTRQNAQSITNKYEEIVEESIYYILKKLNILNYEITEKEREVICDMCKKNVVNFYKFKLMCKNQQNIHRTCIQKKENDKIIDLLNPSYYELLNDFISKYPYSTVFIDADNQLIIKPSLAIIKHEIDSDQVNFIDIRKTGVMIKTEVDNEMNDDQNFDHINQEIENFNDSDENYEINIDNDNDDTSIDEDGNELLENIESKAEAIQEEGVNKIVLNNIEFISRIPECLVDVMKKKQQGLECSLSTSKNKNPENWIRIKQRTARSKGESYTSRTGKLIKAREMKPSCSNCRYKCSDRMTESERLKNFQNYWSLADFIMQKKFLFQHRVVEPVARRRARQENPRNRTYSTKYFLDTFNEDGSFKEMIKVCEKMFTNTLNICKNTIRTLQKKVEMGKVEDLRGQQRRKLSPGHLAALDHIRQFPYFHIEKPMPLSHMFKMYQQECFEKGIEPVKDGTYRKLFSDNNECEFLRQSNKLKCAVCDEYNQANDFEKKSLEFGYQNHLDTNEKCRQRAKWRKSGKLKAKKRKQNKRKNDDDS